MTCIYNFVTKPKLSVVLRFIFVSPSDLLNGYINQTCPTCVFAMIRTLQSEWQELNSGAYPNLRAQGWRERNSRCIGYGRRICRDARDFVVLLSMRESAWTRNCIRHGARNRGRVRRGLGCGREGKNFVKGNAVSSSSIRHNSATCVKSDARSRETTFVGSLDRTPA